ncbi:hypothetical protein LXA43DRAFT_348505 [Ganoderma leucocontextum]|nr:hypothetical protein LXA43DRAFT_348505 [Ganoderma leucocontextum]
MRYSFHTSRPMAIAVCFAAPLPLACAAPTPSYASSEFLRSETREPPLDTVHRSNRYSMLIQRDSAEHEADSLVTQSEPISHHMARPTGGILLEPISSGSSPSTPSVTVGDSCSPAVRLPTEHAYQIAVLTLLSCTFVAAVFNAFYLVYRQWRYKRLHNRTYSTVNVYSSPDTPKRKPRLSISLPDTDSASLKHKPSTSTLYSISEEASTPAKKASFAPPPESSRPPSYTVGPISLPESPALACFSLSSPASQRTVAEGQSSFLPLR